MTKSYDFYMNVGKDYKASLFMLIESIASGMSMSFLAGFKLTNYAVELRIF